MSPLPSDTIEKSGELLTKDDILDEFEKPTEEARPDSDEPETIDLPKEEEDKDQPAEDTDEEESVKEKEEEIEFIPPVKRREILEKYPQFFKDFPQVEKSIFRDKQYSEIFPTPQDASEASEKSSALDNFEQDLGQGNIDKVLDAVKSEDQKAFYKIVDNYLPQLYKVDQQAYYHVIGNITKTTIIQMVSEAKKSGNEALEAAANLLHQFVFGNSDWKPPSKLVHETPQSNEVKQKEYEFEARRINTVQGELSGKIRNSLTATIKENLDPRNSMSDYVRKNASKDVLEAAERAIGEDKQFRSILNKLWDKAYQENYSDESVRKIRSAVMSKAKTVLPSLIKKARAEALGGSPTKESTDKSHIKLGRSTSPSSSGKTPKTVPAGMRTIDFLMQD